MMIRSSNKRQNEEAKKNQVIIVTQCSVFIYLGSLKQKTEIKNLILFKELQWEKQMIAAKIIWKDTDLAYYEFKSKIMKVFVGAYGAKGCTLRSDEKKRIQATEMYFLRRHLNPTYGDRRTRGSILEDLNTNCQLYKIFVNRRMSYFVHMSRKKNLNLTKTIVKGRPDGKRGKGRP